MRADRNGGQRPSPVGFSDSGMRDAAAPSTLATRAGGSSLGDRVRSLRVAAGLTQTKLAGARFSKEYVSQIERGKTRPTEETVAWLAERLGVDAHYLAQGVSADVRSRIEAKLSQAEALASPTAITRPSTRSARRAQRSPSTGRSSSSCARSRAKAGLCGRRVRPARRSRSCRSPGS